MEENETLKESLRREFKEETTFDIDERIEETSNRIKMILTFEVTSHAEISLSTEN